MSKVTKSPPRRAAILAAIQSLREQAPQCEAYHPAVIEAAILPAVMKGLCKPEPRYHDTFINGERFRKTLPPHIITPNISAICAAAARDGFLRKVRVFLPADGRGPKTTVALYDLAEPRTRLQVALAKAWHPSIGSADYGYGGLPKHIREKVAAEVDAEAQAKRRLDEDEDPVTGSAEY